MIESMTETRACSWPPRRLSVGHALVLTGAAAAGLLLMGLSFARDAEARTRCSYEGPPSNVLTVTVTGDALAQIGREGQQIVAGEYLERPRPCSGGVPTVLNTDTIKVLQGGNDAFADLNLDGGPFAPGATPETDGAPEIEVEFSGREAFSTVVGTPRADEFHWGPGEAQAGLNLNPRSAGDEDVDVVTDSPSAFLNADGAAGKDRIIPGPGAPIFDRVFSNGGRGDDFLVAPHTGASLNGESGNDVLTGGRSLDFLDGGAGNDRVAGAGGDDAIDGGRGRDLLSGGPGRDSINARDSKRDTVRCGPGRDRVEADRRDRLRGCELVRPRGLTRRPR
jgi:RTX calcium-binding nonapeptide repeat (4 copies)